MSDVDLLAFKPCRAITTAFVRGQPAGLALRAWAPNGTDLKALAAESNVIIPETVAGLLNEKGIQYGQACLNELVETLNTMRVTVPVDKALVPQHVELPLQRVKKAVAELLKDLPTIIEAGREMGGLGTSTADGLAPLLAAAQNARAVVGEHEPGRRHKSWNDDSNYLAQILEINAHECGRPSGLSKPTAPAIDFIVKALDLAGVKSARPNGDIHNAIAQAWYRYKRDRDQGSKRKPD